MSAYSSMKNAAAEIRDRYESGDVEDLYDEVCAEADNLTPIMDDYIIEEWTEIPTYDSEDYSGDYNIIDQMRYALEEWYRESLLDELRDLRENDGDSYSECGCSNPYCQA